MRWKVCSWEEDSLNHGRAKDVLNLSGKYTGCTDTMGYFFLSVRRSTEIGRIGVCL